MNDTDAISRKDVLDMAYLSVFVDDNGHEVDEPRYVIDATDVERLPSVPHEMSAMEYEKVKDRMRRSNGTDNAYGLYVRALFEGQIDEAVAIVEEWAREHPEENDE